jgi:hypothetical protein
MAGPFFSLNDRISRNAGENTSRQSNDLPQETAAELKIEMI